MNYVKKTLGNPTKAVEAAIKSFSQSRNKIQVACVAICLMIADSADTRKGMALANQLINGTKGLNQAGLVEFFVLQGASVAEGAKGFTNWNPSKVDVDKAKKQLWWDLKPQNPWKGVNLRGDLIKLVAKVDTANKKAIAEPELAELVVVEEAMLVAVKALVA